MKLDCNGNTIDGLVTEIEIISGGWQDITLYLEGGLLQIEESGCLINLQSPEALDNLIKGLQLAKKLGWLQEPKLVDDVADLELEGDAG